MTPSAISDPVRTAALTRPGAPAIVASESTVTWADLDRRVDAATRWLCEHDITFGDRLAVYQPTEMSYLVLLLAAFRCGLTVCPLNTRLPPAAVPPLLERAGVRALVAEPNAAWVDLDVVPPSELFASDNEPRTPNPLWQLSAAATLIFTSGSTGTPKAVLHALNGHVASARGSVQFFDLGPGDRWLLNLPLYHVGGLAILFRCVFAGATVVLPSPEATLEETTRRHGVTHLSLVATQLLRVLRDGEPAALTDTKAILLGGSAIPPGLLTDAHGHGLPVHTSYGMTEMASTVTATPPDALLDALSTSGIVLPNREVELAADGEILVRGQTLFAGYVDEDALALPVDVNGWFHTGDVGTWVEIDGQRMLRIVGRKDNLFISGGENVQPEEIEAALGRLDGIRQAIVVPVADGEFGQRPVAFVEAEVWEPESWREALSAGLARFKIPDAFHPWPDDVQAGIKVGRTTLKERAERYRAA